MTFVLALLPFLAAALVGALPERSRNLAAGVAGATALAGCAILAMMAPAVFAGEVLRASVPWFHGVDFGFRVDGLAFMFARHRLRDRRAGRPLCALLPVARRSAGALLRLSAGVHGRDARRRARRQPDPAGRLLGTDEHHVVPADRLLAAIAPTRGRARGWRWPSPARAGCACSAASCCSATSPAATSSIACSPPERRSARIRCTRRRWCWCCSARSPSRRSSRSTSGCRTRWRRRRRCRPTCTRRRW